MALISVYLMSRAEPAGLDVYKRQLVDAIMKAKPSTVKGAYLKSVTLTSTMGPGVKLNVAKLTN